MKRFHVHVAVKDLQQGIGFYSTLFGAEPTVLKDDYAKWMLEDPRVNFAISTWGKEPGIDHLGFQVDDDEELGEIATRLESAGHAVAAEKNTTCCYAVSDKHWVVDPAGTPWETFRSMAQVKTRGGSAVKAEAEAAALAAMNVAEAETKAGKGCGGPATGCCG